VKFENKIVPYAGQRPLRKVNIIDIKIIFKPVIDIEVLIREKP
jgi:hypothetical protein